MRNIILLGSTGSIGTQVLEIIRRHRDRFACSVLTCGHNIPLLRKQIEEFSPKAVCVAEKEDRDRLAAEFPDLDVLWGEEGLSGCLERDAALVVNALVGISGLRPTVEALRKGHDIALANKETLVTGGSLVTDLVKETGAAMLPIDSEHSAIFQSLQGAGDNPIRKILLTCSGGPFRGYTKEELSGVGLKDALAHPNWSMGAKITVDSATMMNKGFEVIEAVQLFGVTAEQVEVLGHPQSILHSAVEFSDGAVIGQMGTPDMRLPISYALNYPERIDHGYEALDLFGAPDLHFEKPDNDTFICLPLAYDALKRGGTAPVALNGANEVLVDAFLHEKIGFLTIQETLEKIMRSWEETEIRDLSDVLEADKEVRAKTKEVLGLC